MCVHGSSQDMAWVMWLLFPLCSFSRDYSHLFSVPQAHECVCVCAVHKVFYVSINWSKKICIHELNLFRRKAKKNWNNFNIYVLLSIFFFISFSLSTSRSFVQKQQTRSLSIHKKNPSHFSNSFATIWLNVNHVVIVWVYYIIIMYLFLTGTKMSRSRSVITKISSSKNSSDIKSKLYKKHVVVPLL